MASATIADAIASGLQRVYYGPITHDENATLPDLTPREWAGVLPLCAMALVMGIFPMLFLPGRVFSAYCYLPLTGLAIALTGVAATPFVLDGDPQNAIAAAEIFGDRFASEEYRRDLASVVAERALASARERSDA